MSAVPEPSRQRELELELQQWQALLASDPEEPNAWVRLGMAHFKLAQIQESIQAFDRAAALDPAIAPYLWQRGLSYYYAGRFAAAAEQFQLDLRVNGRDVEETVWRYLSQAQLQGSAAARSSLLPVQQDPRPFMGWIYGLFAGTCSPDQVLAIAAKSRHPGPFYLHLYLGLYFEAKQDTPQARQLILKAVEHFPLQDYMWHLGRVHLALRGWTGE